MTSINTVKFDYVNTFLIRNLEDEIKSLRDKMKDLEQRVREMEVNYFFGSVKGGR